MSKTLDRLTTVVLSVFFLCCTLALIAALDEFARIPFYATLPVAACLVIGAALLLIWRRRAPREFAGRIYTKLRSGAHTFSEPVMADRGSSQFDESSRGRSQRADTGNQTQSREVLAAVAKIHSVAWFPARAGNVPPDLQEAMIDHEAR